MYVCLSALTHAHTHNSREGHIPSNFVKRVSGQLLGNKLPRKEFEIMATYVYSPKEEDELPLTEGEKLTVISEPEDGWYLARNNQG